jgi:hypothetical protein
LNLGTALNWSATPWALAGGAAALVVLLCWGAWLTVAHGRNRVELRVQARRAERERIARDLRRGAFENHAACTIINFVSDSRLLYLPDRERIIT